MFFNDHAPPHFHARYGEFEATIDIGTSAVLAGSTAESGFETGPRMDDDT